ncbi:thermonuclease family protein [Brachyspira hyodysenteriae]|uniref:thermonuclease family protein n=2 Tax=Brachyspira hyodysenteriae TaxID=159 RepID=UPI0022CD7C26|nr:thermonuclease family protein [Brachyspira hyodysenteriae]MCZ9878148.1 thermonuclease family protein [Brachyspira hyodysenteriae]MCZ9889655.1 thermonuclease family protein [Brachyspira hyodysenteriae]MCZ9894600.1 thermonuclease family protein [Brachyspira hyodysenteriae]MCZ9898358.1 thermonuclease family protein [Brachyspira hyodysenteriae]MCZ9951895.1 thermonuclease family protein [Brachyspira hyodysenteriae]
MMYNIAMKKLFILLLIFNIAYSQTYRGEITDFELVRVRDGDTFVINIKGIPKVFGKEIAIRIRGIDTPELDDRRKAIKDIAYRAKFELEDLLYSSKKIVLYDLGRDKYFRVLASVKADDIDVGKYLIQKGLAKKYTGKKEW